MNAQNLIIAAIAIGQIALWVFVIYQFKKKRSSDAIESSDSLPELNKEPEEALKSIEKLREETPIVSIDKNNIAYLHTRDGREIHKYQLTRKK